MKPPKNAPKNDKKDCLCFIVAKGLITIFQASLLFKLFITVVLSEFTEAGKTYCDNYGVTAVCSLLAYFLLIFIYNGIELRSRRCAFGLDMVSVRVIKAYESLTRDSQAVPFTSWYGKLNNLFKRSKPYLPPKPPHEIHEPSALDTNTAKSSHPEANLSSPPTSVRRMFNRSSSSSKGNKQSSQSNSSCTKTRSSCRTQMTVQVAVDYAKQLDSRLKTTQIVELIENGIKKGSVKVISRVRSTRVSSQDVIEW
jgi:hypothetical protein